MSQHALQNRTRRSHVSLSPGDTRGQMCVKPASELCITLGPFLKFPDSRTYVFSSPRDRLFLPVFPVRPRGCRLGPKMPLNKKTDADFSMP